MKYEQSDPRFARIIARFRRVQQLREKRIALLATALWLTEHERASPLERPHLVFSSYECYTGWDSTAVNDPPAPTELGSLLWRCDHAMFQSARKAEQLTESLARQVLADVAAEVERRIVEAGASR